MRGRSEADPFLSCVLNPGYCKMIRATLKKPDGRTTLVIGLSFGNLAKFKAEPLDSFIAIDGKLMDLPIDVLLFAGESEGELARFMADRIGPDTKVHIDPKLRT